MKECPICHKEFKNVGSHIRFSHHGSVIPCDNPNEIEVDEITKEPLSKLLSDLKEILNKFRNQMEVKVKEENGKPVEIEVSVKIKL